jgi:Tol biopolymer transport system component
MIRRLCFMSREPPRVGSRPILCGWALGLLLLVFDDRGVTAQSCSTSRASRSWNGAVEDGNSSHASISANGRRVAFESLAMNLVPGSDANSWPDVFVADWQTGQIVRASTSSLGVQGNMGGSEPALSASGRFVAFSSVSTNLVPGDTNDKRDVFVRELQTGQTERVSVSGSGAQAGDHSSRPALSGDGRFVVFESRAANLVAGDTNSVSDVFVFDRQTGTIECASAPPGGAPAGGMQGAISVDGRFVAFSSGAAFEGGDTNQALDIYVRDQLTRTLVRASVATGGAEGNRDSQVPALSADGRYVAFLSDAWNLVANDLNNAPDIFVRDLASATTTRVSVSSSGGEGNGSSYQPAISGNGRFVAFETTATNLVPGDTGFSIDVLVHDLQTGGTSWANYGMSGPPNGHGWWPSLSSTGEFVAFSSDANNLSSGDGNLCEDVYVRDCPVQPYAAFCTGTPGACPCANGGGPFAGCDNSASTGGGLLWATGTPSVSGDTIVLRLDGLPAHTTVIFFQGTAPVAGGNGVPYGDGLRCVGGTVIRLGVRMTTTGSSMFGYGVGSDPLVSVAGQIPSSGATRLYQAYYRDSAVFCTPQTLNLSNGIMLPWMP